MITPKMAGFKVFHSDPPAFVKVMVTDVLESEVSGDVVVDGQHVNGFGISPLVVEGLGPGDTVELTISASGMVGVKQFHARIRALPEEAFNLLETTFSQNSAAFTISPGVEFPTGSTVQTGAATFGAAVEGTTTLGTFTFTMANTYTGVPAILVVDEISIGPNSTNRDVFDSGELGLSLLLNHQSE